MPFCEPCCEPCCELVNGCFELRFIVVMQCQLHSSIIIVIAEPSSAVTFLLLVTTECMRTEVECIASGVQALLATTADVKAGI